MNLACWLERAAALHGAREALFHGRDLVWDYAGLAARAREVAGWLAGQRVGPGERVAIFMANRPEYLPVLFGIWAAGAVAVPINAKLHPREAAWIIGDAEARLALVSSDLAAGLGQQGATCPVVDALGMAFVEGATAVAAPALRTPDDLAWLFYTSGTTGRPKGVMITHRMLATMSLCYTADADRISPDDAALYAAPMSHGAGIYSMMHVLHGARHVVPLSGGFDPDEILDLAAHFGDIHMFAAPTMVRRLTQRAQALGSTGKGLRSVVYAGGPMYLADIIAAVDRFGPVFLQIYGQGECPMGITVLPREDVADRNHPRWRARLGSVGRAQSAVEVMIGDAEGRPLPPGQTGEIMVRGDVVMPGYWRNPEATARTLVNGWLLTGDMGFMDAEGYVTMQDRSKDMIISGGSNIYPREVEEALTSHPDVAEVSVVGQPDAEWGEIVVAFVVPRNGPVDPAALDAHCLGLIARFKRPKRYVHLAELPKNNYGKVLKTELRAMLKEHQT